jgi:ribosome biogenesis GTPase
LNEKDRAFLQGQLSLLNSSERQKLIKRAGLLRKTSPKLTTRHLEADEIDDEGPAFTKLKSKSKSLDEILLKLLREDERTQGAGRVQSEIRDSLQPLCTVLTIHKGRCEVDRDGESLLCELTPEILERQQTMLAVGDHVSLSKRKEHWFVDAVLPRRTKLSRPDPATESRERVIVANIDVVVIVVSVGSPPLHPRLIDRYLVAVQRGNGRPVIAVNKLDLLKDEGELKQLEPYRQIGIPVHFCSADRGTGVSELELELRGQLAAFVGHSGVGKSSLVKRLRPELDLEVGAVSAGNAKGAHTTRRSTLYRLENDTRIIDTPGIRSFGLWALTSEEVESSFPEFDGLSCRFRDCAHTHEPGCGVRAAVEAGLVSFDRYQTFLRLLQSL